MKRVFISSALAFSLIIPAFSVSRAHMMNAEAPGDDHTLREEQEGKEIWAKIKNQELNCSGLSEEEFGALGEYFMSEMTGGSHAAVNQMMIRMMGEEGERQAHISMGKRLSGCDPSAVYPTGLFGFMPMMGMFGPMSYGFLDGYRSKYPENFFNYNMPMMWGYGYNGLGIFGWLFMILWWALIILGIAALVMWLMSERRSGVSGKSALDILKERYAKGEIDRKEFEERKKDLIEG